MASPIEQIRPLGNSVLVKRGILPETVPSSAIVVPDHYRDKSLEASVLAVGAGKLKRGVRIPPEVKAGDWVLIQKHAGTVFRSEGSELELVDAGLILCVLDRNSDSA
jgi:chaperonin GroES